MWGIPPPPGTANPAALAGSSGMNRSGLQKNSAKKYAFFSSPYKKLTNPLFFFLWKTVGVDIQYVLSRNCLLPSCPFPKLYFCILVECFAFSDFNILSPNFLLPLSKTLLLLEYVGENVALDVIWRQLVLHFSFSKGYKKINQCWLWWNSFTTRLTITPRGATNTLKRSKRKL